MRSGGGLRRTWRRLRQRSRLAAVLRGQSSIWRWVLVGASCVGSLLLMVPFGEDDEDVKWGYIYLII